MPRAIINEALDGSEQACQLISAQLQRARLAWESGRVDEAAQLLETVAQQASAMAEECKESAQRCRQM